MKLYRASFALLISTASATAFAQESSTAGGQVDIPAQAGADAPQGPMNFIAIGGGAAPSYPGSKTYSIIPFVAANFTIKSIELSVRGPNIRANLLGESAFSIGPVVSLNFGRSRSDGGVARYLPKIGNEVDVGGYVGYHFGGDAIGQGQVALEITALQDVSSVSKGFTASGTISYVLVRNQHWNIGADANTTYANAKTLRTYFGVSPDAAEESGLSAYSPGSGIRDVGTGVTAGYQFNRRWGLVSRIGYNYLVGDAAKSPIVKVGSRSQLLGGIALSYRF